MSYNGVYIYTYELRLRHIKVESDEVLQLFTSNSGCLGVLPALGSRVGVVRRRPEQDASYACYAHGRFFDDQAAWSPHWSRNSHVFSWGSEWLSFVPTLRTLRYKIMISID